MFKKNLDGIIDMDMFVRKYGFESLNTFLSKVFRKHNPVFFFTS